MYPSVEEQTDRKSTSPWVLLRHFSAGFSTPIALLAIGMRSNPPAERRALILVIVLSLGAWALIWEAVCLLATYWLR